MPDSPAIWFFLVLLAFYGLWQLIGRAAGLDLGGLLREHWFAHQARRWQKQREGPAVLKRTYWTAGEFKRDHLRLAPIGYQIVDQSSPERGSQEFLLGPRSSRYRRRLPAFYVTYQRTAAA